MSESKSNPALRRLGPARLIVVLCVSSAAAVLEIGEQAAALQPPGWQGNREARYSIDAIPDVKLDTSRFRVSPDDEREILSLIDALAEAENDEKARMPPWAGGGHYPRMPGSPAIGFAVLDGPPESAAARLVAFGPKAIPALLRALEDATPSRITARRWGGMGRRLRPKDAEEPPHVVSRGDLCYAVLGQITNRDYRAVRYTRAIETVAESPTADENTVRDTRAAWQSEDPGRTLFDGLMIDFSTRGLGSESIQCGGVIRLLYYFPEASAGLVCQRIDALDVKRIPRSAPDSRKAWQQRVDANGVNAPELIRAVALVPNSDVDQALLRVLTRSDDPSVFHEALIERVVAVGGETVFRRMRAILEVPPLSEQGPFGGEFHTLRKALTFFPDRARRLVELYAGHGTLACRRACLHALMKPDQPIPWAVDYLKPLLEDKTLTGWEYGPGYERNPIRICDEAASALITHLRGARFELEGTHEDLDRQIANIKRLIAGDQSVRFEKEEELSPPVVRDIKPRSPVAVFEFAERLGVIYPISDRQTIYAARGFRGHIGWACETVKIDVETGGVAERVLVDEWRGAVSMIRPVCGDTVFCYHASSSGAHIVERDLRTGALLNLMETPFHGGPPTFDDSFFVWNLQDLAVSGDRKWIMAFTPAGVLYSIKVPVGEVVEEWRFEGKRKFEGMPLMGQLIAIEGRNQFLLVNVPDPMDAPPLIWDQGKREMTEVHKVPFGGWRRAWGAIAWNHVNNRATIWNLETRTQLKLPIANAQIVDVLCDDDQSTIFALLEKGTIEVVDLNALQVVGRLEVPQAMAWSHMTLSSDGQVLFWHSIDDPSKDLGKTQIAVFEVADLVR